MADERNGVRRIGDLLGSASFDQILKRIVIATGAAFVASVPCAILMLALIQLLFGESWQLYVLKVVAWPPYGASVFTLAVFIVTCGAPTALANLAALECLARHRLDNWMIALLCGAIVGLAVPMTVLHVLHQGMFTHIDIASAMVATAIAMALIYWMIAVRPRRRSPMSMPNAVN